VNPFHHLRSTKGLLTLMGKEGLKRSPIQIEQVDLFDRR